MLSACRVLNMPAPHTYAQPLLAATQVSLKQLPPRSLPALLSDLQIVLPIHFSRGPSSADPRVGAWVGEYLQQCQDKLALLTAAGVVDVLAAVSCSGVVPSTAWMSAFAGACTVPTAPQQPSAMFSPPHTTTHGLQGMMLAFSLEGASWLVDCCYILLHLQCACVYIYTSFASQHAALGSCLHVCA